MDKYEERYRATVIEDAKIVAELLGVTPVDIEYNYLSTVWMWLGPQRTDRVEVVGGDRFVIVYADIVEKYQLPGDWYPFYGGFLKLVL
jgi:protoheme ferro-lyase